MGVEGSVVTIDDIKGRDRCTPHLIPITFKWKFCNRLVKKKKPEDSLYINILNLGISQLPN